MATLTLAEASNITAPTQFVATGVETYAYRRFGSGSAPLCLEHFTGTPLFVSALGLTLVDRTGGDDHGAVTP